MPLGSFHIETGMLLTEGKWLILDRDEGGRWRLDAPSQARKFLGQRVRVEGMRSDFDLLDVVKIEKI